MFTMTVYLNGTNNPSVDIIVVEERELRALTDHFNACNIRFAVYNTEGKILTKQPTRETILA